MKSLLPADESVLRDLLPDTVIDIIEVIGYEATRRLIENLGGNDFEIPHGKTLSARRRRLIDAIGNEAAHELMDVYGGASVYIPRCTAALTALRNQQFRTAVAMEMDLGSSQVMAIQKLAPVYGFTERWAYEILRERATPHQSRLF